jgi:hypothetical protein
MCTEVAADAELALCSRRKTCGTSSAGDASFRYTRRIPAARRRVDNCQSCRTCEASPELCAECWAFKLDSGAGSVFLNAAEYWLGKCTDSGAVPGRLRLPHLEGLRCRLAAGYAILAGFICLHEYRTKSMSSVERSSFWVIERSGDCDRR